MGVESGANLLVRLTPEIITAVTGCALLLIGVAKKRP